MVQKTSIWLIIIGKRIWRVKLKKKSFVTIFINFPKHAFSKISTKVGIKKFSIFFPQTLWSRKQNNFNNFY